jgi:hypothetical protein
MVEGTNASFIVFEAHELKHPLGACRCVSNAVDDAAVLEE